MGTSYSLVQTLLLQDVSFNHNAWRHRRTDGQRDDIIMTIAARSYCHDNVVPSVR